MVNSFCVLEYEYIFPASMLMEEGAIPADKGLINSDEFSRRFQNLHLKKKSDKVSLIFLYRLNF
jgi:hypothetical protein